jgi:hypothetical protein
VTAGPIDTKLVLAQCQKCQGYVFNAQVNGCDTVVDVVASGSIVDWRNALVEGKSLYIATMMNGKPYKLSPVYAKQIKLAETGGHALYATHGCAAAGTVRASKVEVAPEGPQQAPVTPGGLPGGFRRAGAPVSGSQGPSNKITMEDYWGVSRSPARPAILRPSRCAICRGLLTGKEKGATVIEYNGRIIWGMHEH